jgi:hypothetical protein
MARKDNRGYICYKRMYIIIHLRDYNAVYGNNMCLAFNLAI